MSVTIEDVALRVKLNKGSVSRILNGKGEGYSVQTRQRVIETAAEMGYKPNALARALWTGQSHTIAMWLLPDDTYSPYFAYMQHCAQRLLDKQGYKMITESVPQEVAQGKQTPQGLYWPVDGIISCYMTRTTEAYLHSVAKKGCPVVDIRAKGLRELEDYPDTDYLLIDLYQGAKQAVEHLLSSGGHRIAFVSEPQVFAKDPRARAYSELMSEAGKATELVSLQDDTRMCGYESMKVYIESHGCPDGLFCTNDEVAIGCYVALHELGIQIPNDVLLVGFDGLENARLFPCPISSVIVPIEELFATAWEMLSQRMKNPELPMRQQTLTTHLEIRASSQR